MLVCCAGGALRRGAAQVLQQRPWRERWRWRDLAVLAGKPPSRQEILRERLRQIGTVVLVSAYVGGVVVFRQKNKHRVPITNREQVNLYPDDDELKLGTEELERILEGTPEASVLAPHEADYKLVRRILLRLVPIAEAIEGLYGEREWNLTVIDDSMVNAFCLPGGVVVVYTGLLRAMQDECAAGRMSNMEDGVAAVLAHEIGHVLAHHGAEGMSSNLLFSFVFGILTWGSPFMQWLHSLAANSYSRLHESEADEIGMHIMARACYDLKVATPLHKMLDQSPWFTTYSRTHPTGDQRAEAIEQLMPELRIVQRQHCKCDAQGRCKPFQAAMGHESGGAFSSSTLAKLFGLGSRLSNGPDNDNKTDDRKEQALRKNAPSWMPGKQKARA